MNLIDAFESMNQFLNQSYFFRAFKFFLSFYLIIMILIIIGIIYRLWGYYTAVLFKGSEYKPEIGKYEKRWIKVNQQIESGDLAQCSAAVLDCSQMLNEVLKAIGYEGDSLGERLDKLVPGQIDNIEKLRVVNEVKNKIIQDPNFKITQEEAAGIRDVVGRTLDDFEVIEIDE